MSHSSKAVSHRRGEGPRRRSIVRVTMLIMLAMVAQACGSSSSSDTSLAQAGAQEDAVTSADWKFEVRQDDGSPLERATEANGVTLNKLVVHKGYRFTASVPLELVQPNHIFVVEYQYPGESRWYGSHRVLVDATGKAMGTFYPQVATAPRDYRLSAYDSSPNMDARLLASSDVVRAISKVEFSIALWNTTSNNLTIKLPVKYNESTKDWTYFEVGVGIGETKTLRYVNPSPVGFSMVLNKQKCFSSCTNYFMDWAWQPTNTGRTQCASVPLSFGSGRAYTVKLSDNVDGQRSGWKTGIISGPLLGPQTADTNCTFTTRTKAGQFLVNNPIKGAAIIGAIALVAIATVVVAVVLAPAVIASLAGEAVLETVEADVEWELTEEEAEEFFEDAGLELQSEEEEESTLARWVKSDAALANNFSMVYVVDSAGEVESASFIGVEPWGSVAEVG